MRIVTSIILFLFYIQVKAYGAPRCSNVSTAEKSTKSVDLVNEMPPIKDQDSIGWCYGFTTADLLTHYLYKNNGKNIQAPSKTPIDYRKKEYNVSAVGVSNIYNQSKKSSYAESLNNKSLSELQKSRIQVVAEGGNLASAMMIVQEKGFCFEKDVSSQDFSYVVDSRCAIKYKCNIGEILKIIYDGPKDNIVCQDLKTIQSVFPILKIQDIKNILESVARQDALSSLVNASCKEKFTKNFHSSQPAFESRTIKIGESSNQLMSFLDRHLDRGIPVGIMYYADFLIGKSVNVSAHASSIVGKAFNPQTCEVEYILRNSWGRGCGFYLNENPKYAECLNDLKQSKNSLTYFRKMLACRNNNRSIPKNPRVRCVEPEGHVYIRKSDLAKHIYNTTAIQEDKI